jgi:hypothetical protein
MVAIVSEAELRELRPNSELEYYGPDYTGRLYR